MHLVYIDDSKDTAWACFSALIIPAHAWNECLERVVGMRRALWESDGIFQRKEIHATEWLGGRGRIAGRDVGKYRRAMLYRYVLSVLRTLPSVQIINAASAPTNQDRIFEYLLNRIQKNMEKSDSRCIIFSDEGKEFSSLLRKMRKFNNIPSKYRAWSSGILSKNIPTDRIIEDIIQKNSAHSFFIQMADCCAFALLRYLNPTPKAVKYKFDNAFLDLDGVLVKAAFTRDPLRLGIIR